MNSRNKLGAGILPMVGIAGCMVLASTAHANDGWYLGGEGGYNFAQHPTFDINNIPVIGSTSFGGSLKDGYAVGVVTGFSLPVGFRPEASFDYRNNDVESFSSGSASTTNVSGHESVYSLMGNMWYDIKAPYGVLKLVHPYLGGGIGVARVGLHSFSFQNASGQNIIDEDKTLFAYQGGAGVNVDVAPNLMLSADYRYIETEHGDYSIESAPSGTTLSTRYRSQSAMVGLRFLFGSSASSTDSRVE